MEGRDNSVPEGTVWIDLEALFRKKAQKNSKNRIAIAAEKLQWCVLEDDTLSYYEARPGTDHRPKESRLLGSYNMIQVIECTRQATAPTFSPKALRGFTLRFVGGKSVSLVPTSRKIDVDYWVSQINARRAFFRRQQEETHQLVERGIERITNISELKKELGVGKDELPLQYSSVLVDADGGGDGSDSEDYDWVDDEEEDRAPPPPPPEDSDALVDEREDTDDLSVEPRPPPTPKANSHDADSDDDAQRSVLRERSATAAAAAAIPFRSELPTLRDDFPNSSASSATQSSQDDTAAEFAQLLERAAHLEQETQLVKARTAASARQHQIAMTRQHNQGGEEAQRLLDEARASANVEGKIADLEAAHKAKLDAIETRVAKAHLKLQSGLAAAEVQEQQAALQLEAAVRARLEEMESKDSDDEEHINRSLAPLLKKVQKLRERLAELERTTLQHDD